MTLAIRRLSTKSSDFSRQLAELTSAIPAQNDEVESTVAKIISDVRRNGDEAVVEYTRKFDSVHATSVRDLEIGQAELDRALGSIGTAQKDALTKAADRIRRFHERQVAVSWEYTEADGTRLGQRVTPLERVGLYVPGGKAAYPSSVLMNAIPAKVAGVRELVMVSPTPHGERNPLVLAAAAIAGVDRVIAIGGAQAVGALAFGTRSIARVHKIVGPGNAYVAAAKRQVFGVVGIDMIAGPSEVLIISDGKTSPDWIAMDLFSQAEHDENARAILLCPDAAFLDLVTASIEKLIDKMDRRSVISAALAVNGALILTRDLDEACLIANDIAPEHLELSVRHPDVLLPKISHAGAIFLGPYSSESIGDYCAGPNHVLPTSGTARFSSPLGVYDFQKRTSVVGVSKQGAESLGRIAATLARGEGLQAHALSAEYRF
jgi:histidinol dehydrogenase